MIKSMKLSQYFQIIKPTYTYLKLIPDTSIRNYNSSNIAKAVSYMYKSIFDCIRREESKLIFETQVKCSYLIDIRKNSAEFFFVVPIQYESIAREKIRETWPKVTIELVGSIQDFSKDALTYQLSYLKEDALSLNINKANNDPLNSILNVIEIMQEDDRIGIYYNFIPCSQFPWKKQYSDTIKKVKKKQPVEREKLSPKFIVKAGLTILFETIDNIMEVMLDFMGTPKKKDNTLDFYEVAADMLHNNISLSSTTLKKKEAQVLNMQAIILSESKDPTRQNNNALTVCQAYRTIDEDNELTYKKIKNTWNINELKVAGAEENKLSVDECSNFLQLPGRELLMQYQIIHHVNTLETDVPGELREGTKLIGDVTYRGQEVKAHLTTDKEYKNLAVAIIGPSRSGKTTLLGNLSRNSVDAGECVIVLDYIENCGLSDSIKEHIPKDKILEINLYDYNSLQGFGYNEAYVDKSDPFLKYKSAKEQTSQIVTLINLVNLESNDFTHRMERYLRSAAVLVLIQDGPIRDVFNVLQDHKVRWKYINSIPQEQKDNLEEHVSYLAEIDEWSKETKDTPAEIVGTKSNAALTGILDRMNSLKDNTYMELMLKKDTKGNINLLEEMEKNQAIFIKMPESMFGTAEERDMMTAYWLTKVWMAAQARAWKITDRYKRKTVTVITDEIAQLKSSEHFVGSKLDQTAKFGVKFILSTMYINQLRIRDKLRTSNTSYILISGSDKTNFAELKEEFSQFGYCLEDLLSLKRYHSLNYIKYEKGYAAFITHLKP